MGSSPLTRGKREPRAPQRSIQGLIPAHAGKTAPATPGRPSGWLIPAHAGKTATSTMRKRRLPAHPRSRGENLLSRCLGRFRRGSSPLTRGKPVQHLHSRAGHGLIPAHAGKTSRAWLAESGTWAHPRSRGENLGGSAARPEDDGSSPLTRGKPSMLVASLRRTGLIPAHAGKTLPDLRFYRADRSDLGKP